MTTNLSHKVTTCIHQSISLKAIPKPASSLNFKNILLPWTQFVPSLPSCFIISQSGTAQLLYFFKFPPMFPISEPVQNLRSKLLLPKDSLPNLLCPSLQADEGKPYHGTVAKHLCYAES